MKPFSEEASHTTDTSDEARSQKPGARSRKPEARSQKPGIKHLTPLVMSKPKKYPHDGDWLMSDWSPSLLHMGSEALHLRRAYAGGEPRECRARLTLDNCAGLLYERELKRKLSALGRVG